MSNQQRLQLVEDACAALLAAGRPVTFDDVAAHARLGRATLCRNPNLRSWNTEPAAEKPTPSPE